MLARYQRLSSGTRNLSPKSVVAREARHTTTRLASRTSRRLVSQPRPLRPSNSPVARNSTTAIVTRPALVMVRKTAAPMTSSAGRIVSGHVLDGLHHSKAARPQANASSRYIEAIVEYCRVEDTLVLPAT